MHDYPDLESLANADENQLREDLKTVGYNIQRAKLIKEVASDMLSKFGGIPDDLESLLSVKNIGLYTVAAILSLGYGKPMPMVDSNVMRIAGRFYGKKMNQRQALQAFEKVMPREHRKFNLALLDFGALICRYTSPRCGQCPLSEFCQFAAAQKRTPEAR